MEMLIERILKRCSLYTIFISENVEVIKEHIIGNILIIYFTVFIIYFIFTVRQMSRTIVHYS